ncbi:cation:proton antiporter [Streptomyces sp. P9-2B-2]|uniref:cation:proton antiporter n=1 Tax=Streptomyces sp. P9-2B-2 TaxID=3057114 RepID=UPI0025B41996|nr:cation:proton antiporter [Streptomyces sp. P9-2B-2]WJY37075.1 cation:proton antiporter [Streptomyces sp. P9-2B-2]
MSVGGVVLFLAHVAACLAVVLALAWFGRAVARWLRQPEVIGEITGGLLAGPALHGLVGADAFGLLLPDNVLGALKLLGEAGLALFLVGLTHELRAGPSGRGRRAVSWIVFGAMVPSLFAGTLLAGWVLLVDDPALRGTAPLPAFVLFLAVALSITAVPVLARIMADRGLTTSPAGRLALTGAIVLDGVGWVLLSIVVGLDTGSAAGSLRVLAIMAAAVVGVLLLRGVLRTEFAVASMTRFPRLAAAVVGVAAIAAALTTERLGLSMIFGAALFGLAIPADASPDRSAVVPRVTGVGQLLVPVFFVVTGVTVLTTGLGSAPWALLVLSTVLGVLGKIGGGYLGARLGGESRSTAARVGILLNTRGLTELIVLQVGHSAGIVTAPMFLALVVMALSTTALTGPLLSLLDRAHDRTSGARARPRRVAAPAGK